LVKRAKPNCFGAATRTCARHRPTIVPRRTCTPATSGPCAAPRLLCVTQMGPLDGATRRSPTRRTAAPPCAIDRSLLHVATPCGHAMPMPRHPVVDDRRDPFSTTNCLYKRLSPLLGHACTQSSASAVPSFLSSPPWPPIGEHLPPIDSVTS
jgi:hypothetical protein